MINLKLIGQIPSGKGQKRMAVIRGRVMQFPNKRFKDWREVARRQLMTQAWRHGMVASPCVMRVNYYPGDRIRRDVSGMLDALFHLFEHVGLVANDYFIQDVVWTSNALDRVNPRTEIQIETKEILADR